MKPFVIVTKFAENAGFTGAVRISDGLVCDAMLCSEAAIKPFEISSIGRLEMLLQDAVSNLAKYPKGTQAVRWTHYRIPPCGSHDQPLGLELEAIVVEDDREHGDYLLLAQYEELNHAKALSATA